MNHDHYILENREVVPVDLMTWAKWFENADDRRIAETIIGGARVSTVFLGIDHSFGNGSPLLFETMIFGGHLDGYQTRCSTMAEAETMHEIACGKALRKLS